LRTLSNDNAVANMSLAVDREFSKEKQTDFFRIVVFGKQAENCNQYLAKGSQVAIKGRVQNNNYEKDGVKHYGTDIIADRVEFLGSKSDKLKEEKPSGLFDEGEGFQEIESGQLSGFP